MKIIQAKGQTCNQFWIYSNFLADAIENNEIFAIWVPDIKFNEFPSLLNSPYVVFPLYSKGLAVFFGFVNYINFINFFFKNKIILKTVQFFINNFTNHKFLICDVNVRKSKYKFKHLDKIINSFRPPINICNNIDVKIKSLKSKNDLIFGIHIRRGDYITYQKGKYFFSFSQYALILSNIIKITNTKNVVFILISNEKIDRTFFSGFNCYFPSSSLVSEDLYFLSQADYILGPPSTFSAWSSLYNNSFLYFIENPDSEIRFNNFIDIKSIWF
jgi:hypothetical protein